MRVLVTASTFPLHEDDGTPRFVLDLCEGLARHCEVTVLAPDAPNASRRESVQGLDVRRFSYFWPRRFQRLAYGGGIPDNLRRSWLARIQTPGFVWAQARAVRALVAEKQIDLVNSHWIVPQGLAAALARGRTPRFRHVATLHGGDSYFAARLPGAVSLVRAIAARTDAFVAVSSNVRTNLDRLLGRPSNALLQPVGVHVERFRTPVGAAESVFPDGSLVFVGRLIAIKGVDVLLRALSRVREQHPGLGLVVIGYGPLEANLRAQAEASGLAEWVHFAGRRSHPEIATALQGCRAAVVPSIVDSDGRAEGMPSVILEALAAGARVIGTDAGGVPDTLRPGQTGWLARPGDDADLAAKILDALGSPRPPDIDAVADALDWEAVAARTYGLFEDVVRAA